MHADRGKISFHKCKAEANDSWVHRHPGLSSRGSPRTAGPERPSSEEPSLLLLAPVSGGPHCPRGERLHWMPLGLFTRLWKDATETLLIKPQCPPLPASQETQPLVLASWISVLLWNKELALSDEPWEPGNWLGVPFPVGCNTAYH